MSTTLCTKCGQSCGEAEYIIHVANDCQTVRCPKCPQFYYNEESLLRHTRAVHDKEFSCTICQIEYASKYNLKRHMALAHKQIADGQFKCEECGEVYVSKFCLKRHMQRVHNGEFICTLCAEECESFKALRKHMRRNHPDIHVSIDGKKIIQAAKKPIKVDCPKCGKPIAKPSLERHFRMKHSKSFICHVCDRECPSEKALDKHIESRHGEEVNAEVLLKKRYKCPQCPQRFTAIHTLKTHIKGKHEKQFQCNVCQKIYSAPFPLIRHRMKVHGIQDDIPKNTEQDETKKYKCVQCPQRFQSESTLRMHIKGIHEERYKCEVCGKLFISPSHLIRHRTNVHGLIEYDNKIETEKQASKKYKCPQCSQRFTASWTLKTHIKGKHEQQFQCDVCEKYFSAPFPLLRHRRSIHGLTEDDDNETEKDSKNFVKDFGTTEDVCSNDDSDESSNDLPLKSLEIKMEANEEDEELTNEESTTFSIKEECV